MPLEATLREKNCVVCGEKFKPGSARQKHCSDLCRLGTSTCLKCGKEFIRKGNTSGNFCSAECWYSWDGRVTDKECPICHTMFRPKHSKQKTCSNECGDKIRQTAKRRTNCEHCGKPLKSNIAPKVRFCSKSCAMKDRDRKGQLNAPVGARQKHSNGYMMIKMPGNPGAYKTGWMLEHRYVMEEFLGRALNDDEHVHHKNGDRSDNRLENLELWSGKKDPPGQRQIDRAKDLVLKMSADQRSEFLSWLQALEF